MKPPATKNVKATSQPSAPTEVGDAGMWECNELVSPAMLWALWLKLKVVVTSVAVEPVMLLDGLAYSIMIVFVENLQMDKICLVNLNLTAEVCNNLSSYPEDNLKLQQSFSVFGMYNGIIMAFLPLFFILFMGAWSDKYGRKIPLLIATLGHLLWAAGYLINSWVSEWPVEYLLVAALFDSLGGGTVSFLTAANAYISDVTSEETRTSRVGFANSIWFMGGPIGTLLGTYIFKYGGYQILFATSFLMHFISLIYLFFLPESHGPFAKHNKSINNIDQPEANSNLSITFKRPSQITDTKNEISVWDMIRDFFNYGRIVDSFRCTFKPRGGMVRAFILLLILCNLLRRLGRGAYMYLFTRRVLGWRATDYGLWVTYKNFVAALGSLVAVPLLSIGLGVSDNYLAILGALASVADYILYGLVSESTYFLVWIAPSVALLVNSCTIAIRSMLSKFVMGDELGKVSAVMGALDGVMPMISFSLYTSVYHATVHAFPGAQFFFGASSNLLMTLIFVIIIISTSSKSYGVEDIDTPEGTEPVKTLSVRYFGNDFHQQDSVQERETQSNTHRTTAFLSSINFHLATPSTTKRNLPKESQLSDKNLTKNLTAVSTISEADKKRLVNELCNPKKNTVEKEITSQPNVSSGVDNPVFCVTEDECRSIPETSTIDVVKKEKYSHER